MTVAELLEKLKDFAPTTTVGHLVPSYMWGDYTDEIYEARYDPVTDMVVMS